MEGVAIKELFCIFGECAEPCPLRDTITSLGADINFDVQLPVALQSFLQVASEWHLITDHMGVFGCNIMCNHGRFLSKIEILGDIEMVDKWSKDHNSPNIGQDRWYCFCAVSEFQYIFILLDAQSAEFGATRLIVNNCWEDIPLTSAPFENFLILLEAFAKEYVENKRSSITEAGKLPQQEVDFCTFAFSYLKIKQN